MGEKYKRRKYFIHPSSQGAYIALSILPALIMSLYCAYFLISSGELVLEAAKEKPLVPFYSIRHIIVTLEKEGCTEGTAVKLTTQPPLNILFFKSLNFFTIKRLTHWSAILNIFPII